VKANVLKERGEIFVGRYIKMQPNGIAIFKVRNSDNMPRKNSFWTASFLIGEMGSFKHWGDNTWANLRKNYQRTYSDALCAWIQKSEEQDFCIIGIKNLSTDFADLLEKEKPIIAFGPQEPPLKYLLNLIDIVRDSTNLDLQKILDYSEPSPQWNPRRIAAKEDFTTILLNDLESNNNVVVQGPPGTGKTYRMAQLAAKLLKENKSVLVTALTNQALIELAKKDNIKQFLANGAVYKTSLTVDESKEIPSLRPVKENLCYSSNGHLTLATFYLSSGWALEMQDKPFDYVIVDEASQAVLPMLAASTKLGKKVIWIGDQNQLSPIIMTNEDIINKYQWSPIVKGFETICHQFTFNSYMLCDSFRLTQRGADSTGFFYDNQLRSVAEEQTIPSKFSLLNPKGGPVFVGLDLQVGDKAPLNALESIFDYIRKIISETPKAEIAILSKFRETVRQLQKYFVLNWTLTKDLPDNLRIETVDRVQGLTVDYCIFFIPNASIRYSLDNKLFNVATSRAKYNTIIVSDNALLKQNMTEEVRKYLLKAQEEKFASFEPQTITAGNIGVTITGKIDLSKFERKRRELVEGKENIYIIDTNVFVNCPDIISRIGTQYKIVIPATVLEELDKLKLKADIDKKNLNNAAKNINIAFTKHFSSMEDAEVSLLPAGFDKHNPDCKILSVALKYKNENPILLTSDNMLQSRANGLGITTISLKEFLKK
jgi:rRNA-processing protein FCF1/DNA polymerase III delta prime subunit